MAEQERGFSVVFQEADDRRTLPVSGAWGGPTAQGFIAAHFFAEYAPTPSIMTGSINAEGVGQLDEGGTIRRADVIREVVATLMMPPDVAERIGRWLIEKAEIARGEGSET